MKTAIYFITTLLVALLTISCKKYDAFGNEIKSYNEIQKANWLVGEWQHTTDSTNLVETWKRENDSTLTATSYFIQNKKDTLHRESIELVQNNNLLIYTTTITGENNDEPIVFQKTIETETELIFENPNPDYPRKIIYKKMAAQQLQVTIFGTVNKKSENQVYTMTKT